MVKITLMRNKIFAFLRWFFIVALLTLVLLESTLQIASLFVEKRHGQFSATMLPNSKLRVVAMGDSNTYGLYLKAEEAYPAVLQSEWNQHHPDNKIEVINLGFPGTNSSRVLKSMPDVIKTFSPDIITVMIGANDFWEAPVDVGNNENSLSSVESWFRDHSRTYKLIYMLRREFYDENKLVVDDEYRDLKYDPALRGKFVSAIKGDEKQTFENKPNAIRYGDKSFDIGYIFDINQQQNPTNAMKENMLRMADLANANGIKLIFITYAYFEFPQKTANQQMKVVAKTKKIPLINITKVFRDNCAIGESRCKELFFPDYHPTAEGYHLVADEIEKYFLTDQSTTE